MSGFTNRGPQDAPRVSAYSPGPQMFDPTLLAAGGGYLADSGVLAKPGGRPAGNQLICAVSRINPCATAGDAVLLPPAIGGQMLAVSNGGVASAQVYAAVGTSDTINGVAAATGVALAAGKSALFCCAGPGVWFTIPSVP